MDDFRVQTVRYALSNSEISEIVPAFQSRGDCLVFIGNGANPTNIDAMKWFFDDIFELLIDIIHPSQVHLKLIGQYI